LECDGEAALYPSHPTPPNPALCNHPHATNLTASAIFRAANQEQILFLRPRTLQDALEALASTGGVILAGGTDIFPSLGDRPLTGTVIDISGLQELRGIEIGKSEITIGGRTTWSDIVSADLPRGFDGLKAAAREVGSVQIQNQATVAGNICNASPAADGVAALLALDAGLTLTSADTSRELPLSEFILGNRRTAKRPDEILTSIRVPRRLENAASVFLKLGSRRYLVISIVMIAANLVTDEQGNIREALIAVGSCSPRSVRLPKLEHALVGRSIADDLRGAITVEYLAPLSPIDDVRGTAVYRNDAALTLLQRALAACAEKAG
jgi:CO/xanthine dehydrogenase FAD-binding subunit